MFDTFLLQVSNKYHNNQDKVIHIPVSHLYPHVPLAPLPVGDF